MKKHLQRAVHFAHRHHFKRWTLLLLVASIAAVVFGKTTLAGIVAIIVESATHAGVKALADTEITKAASDKASADSRS